MRRNFTASILIAAVIIILLAAAFTVSAQNTGKTSPPAKASGSQAGSWVSLSYAKLINPKEIVRTGDLLKNALKDKKLKGAVQPFLDKYSELMPLALEMIYGPENAAFVNVADEYAESKEAPAWVILYKSGRILMLYDNGQRIKLFLAGDKPKAAFLDNYMVVRHALNKIRQSAGLPLDIEVYAYKNEYASEKIRLNTEPYRFTAGSFELPANAVPLDLPSLDEFFQAGGQLEGAKIDRITGLTLFAKREGKQSLAGYPLSLSDLAVAYRAVFHAGDNEAFISLDPHPDITKVRANFGGYLDNTRIGKVVLEADKRFKTITCGLDPNSFEDMRAFTRRKIGDFLTSDERSFLRSENPGPRADNWIGTRFWFYPESIEVHSDENGTYGAIVNPRFTADAERSVNDFGSRADFEKFKKAHLPQSILKNIDHLNRNYGDYQEVYPELHELSVVGRLMGICSWLYKAKPVWLDLDSLLTVTVPYCPTGGEKDKLLSVSAIAVSDRLGITEDYVKEMGTVNNASMILNDTVDHIFENPGNYALFYRDASGEVSDGEKAERYGKDKGKKIREVVKGDKELRALLSFYSKSIAAPLPPIVKEYQNIISADREKIKELTKQLEDIDRILKNASGEDRDTYAARYNELAAMYNSTQDEFRSTAEKLNGLGIRTISGLGIGGGINLEPGNFNIKKKPKSLQLAGLYSAEKAAKDMGTGPGKTGDWIKSAYRVKKAEAAPKVKAKTQAKTQSKTKQTGGEQSKLTTQAKPLTPKQPKTDNYNVKVDKATGNWSASVKKPGNKSAEKYYDKTKKVIHEAEFTFGKQENHIVGKRVSGDEIIFEFSGEKLTPQPE